jgi:hypothetical protein
MFNLEQSIAEWRQQMLAAGINKPALVELEAHLRDGIERQIHLGSSSPEAFELAVREMGDTKQIKREFMKLENWNRPLAWMAWAIFVTSFFLIAVNETWGWQCAWISAGAISWDWQEFSHGNLGAIWLASLTLANLLMVVSPLLLYSKIGSAKWLRWLFLGAWIWVWTYIVGLMATGALHQLKIGCYAWGLSYSLLCLSMFIVRSPKTLSTQNV